MRPSLPITCLAVGLLASAAARAGGDFSADTVMTGPQGQTLSSHMVVSQGRLRVEYQAGGESVVQINDPVNDKIWTLYPLRQQFSVRDAPPGALTGGFGAPKTGSPCAAIPEASCTDLGEDMIQGRKAHKWQVSMTRQGRTLSMTQWTDQERGFPLRQDFGDGNGAELVLLGKEDLDGRQVEKWELTQHRGQDVRHEYQWYDPELRTTIKELKQDGSSRELRNIQVGPQDPTLFQIPQGYAPADADAGGY